MAKASVGGMGLHGGGNFEQTRWSILLSARDPESLRSAEALEQFSRMYWQPLYHFVRREGRSAEDAQDLVQGFFYHFLKKRLLDRVSAGKGRFRSYLLTCLKHFLADERDRDEALKRKPPGGLFPLESFEEEEGQIARDDADLSAEHAYDRRWARSVLDAAQERLRQEYVGRGRGEVYEVLRRVQFGGDGELLYSDIGLRLGMSEQAVKNAVGRMRTRYCEFLRSEVTRCVSAPEDVDDELRHLVRVLGEFDEGA